MNRFIKLFKKDNSKEVYDQTSVSDDSSADNGLGFGALDWLKDESKKDFLGTSDYGLTMTKRY